MNKEFFKNKFRDFLENLKEKEFVLYTHIDTDGICSSFLLKELLKNRLRKIYFLKELNKDIFKEIKEQNVIFCDLGSNLVEEINSSVKNILVIDHHIPSGELNSKSFFHGENIFKNKTKISSTGLCFLIFLILSGKEGFNPFYVAFFYASLFSDVQVDERLNLDPNLEKLERLLIKKNVVFQEEDLYLYGNFSKNLLDYLNFGLKKNISSRELAKLINLKNSFLENLSWEDLKKRDKEKIIEKFQLSPYLLKKRVLFPRKNWYGEKIRFVKDPRELGSFINSLGKMGFCKEAFIFLKTLKEEGSDFNLFFELNKKYKKEIAKFLRKVKEKKYILLESTNLVIFDLKKEYRSELIGTLTSIIFHGELKKKKLIIGFGEKEKDILKASFRSRDLKLSPLFEKIRKNLKLDPGGHDYAGGCILTSDKMEALIDLIISELR